MSLWNLIEWWQLDNIQGKQQRTNDLMAQNNQLLEQIRRLQLTPEQLAIEEAQRAAAARAQAERDRRNTGWCLGLGAVIIIAFLIWAVAFAASRSSPATSAVPANEQYPGAIYIGPAATPEIQPTATPAATPDDHPAPRAQLVKLPPRRPPTTKEMGTDPSTE
jgi:hypothetical protein